MLSSVQPARAHEGSWWARLEALCAPTDADEPLLAPAAGNAAPSFHMKKVPAAPAGIAQAAIKNIANATVDARAAAFGQAVHRLLEWALPATPLPAAHVRAAAREFLLDAAQARGAAVLAERIRAGQGAWAWDARMIDWHGNEVTLVHEGEPIRIDRLVRHRETGAWWVLDYKSAARPERDDALLAQMGRYRAAVQNAYPGATVRAAFLTGQGQLIEIE